jgi:hypothetical protein
MKIYTVCFANSTQDDNGSNKAYGDVLSAHKTLEDAKISLEKYKNEIIDEIVQGLEGDDLVEAYDDIELYGSVDEGHFEICNCYWDVTYIRISEVNL